MFSKKHLNNKSAVVAHLAERFHGKEEARGSSPRNGSLIQFIKFLIFIFIKTMKIFLAYFSTNFCFNDSLKSRIKIC